MRQNFYSGRYNPYRYAQQGESEIYSMYNPEAEDKFLQAVAGRQERFDASVGAVAQEKARIGDLETYDSNLLEKKISDFEEGITDIVQNKYKGDYSAAAPELVSLIAKERSHPFYRYNKQKVQAVDQYNQMRQQLGANFLSTKNPAQVGFDEWQQGADFGFTPINRNDIVKNSEAVFSNLAKTMQNDPQFAETAGGQYFLAVMQTGFSDPAQVMEFLQTDVGENMVNQITESMPELQQLDSEAVMGAISQGAMSAIGQTQSQFLQNRNFMTDLQKAELLGKQNAGGLPRIVFSGFMNADELGSQIDELNSEFIQSFRNDLMEEMMKDPRYQDLQEAGYDNYDQLTALSRRIEPQTQTSLRPSGTGTAYRVPKDVKDLITDIQQKAIDFKSEFDDRLKNILSDEGLSDDATKDRYGIRVYDFNELAGTDTSSINEINNIKKAANNFLKELSSEDLTFMHPRKDKKAYEDMTLDSMNILSFGTNPVGNELIINVKGEDSEGNPKESRLLLSDQQDASRFIGYISALEPQSEAARRLTTWHAKNNGYLDQLLNQTQ